MQCSIDLHRTAERSFMEGPSGVGCKTNLFAVRWDPSAEWKLRAEETGV